MKRTLPLAMLAVLVVSVLTTAPATAGKPPTPPPTSRSQLPDPIHVPLFTGEHDPDLGVSPYARAECSFRPTRINYLQDTMTGKLTSEARVTATGNRFVTHLDVQCTAIYERDVDGFYRTPRYELDDSPRLSVTETITTPLGPDYMVCAFSSYRLLNGTYYDERDCVDGLEVIIGG